MRIDCFSDVHFHKLSLPNRLFFDEGGLIPLFNRYKFTVEENTPVEQEVALDPELLGKVFENLLAAYNPETRETARKQTGSYYTPRQVVDYMVDEALKHCLEQKVEQTFLSAHAQITPTAAPSSSSEITTTRRHLPHWKTDGSIYWITFRLADAIPQDKLRAWQEERGLWLKRHPKPWSEAVWNDYDQRFGAQMQAWLDAGMGSRALARPNARDVVTNSLLRFDGERLRLHAAVIMPTHVHLLLEPLGGHDLSRILKGIKGTSAREINKLLGTTGTFWLAESYDHIVRSEKQYRRLIRYIADNPVKAGLREDEYWHYQGGADLPGRALEERQGQERHKEDGQTRMSVPPLRPLAERLDQLVSYFYEPPDFTEAETKALVHAIAGLKILDPAVGSGAFPMGVLHKLTLALKRLDPRNEHWEALQKARAAERAAAAFDAPSQQERDDELAEISNTFERYRDSDFGRKLYLMQNSIFGVDVQPVACQIAKLRFFISLAIEQEPDPQAANFGIKPLPNLETRFIAADTLIGLRLSEAGPLLQNDAVQQKRKAIEAIRERYFLANNRRTKRDLDRREKEHREQLEQVLEDLGAEWAAYQQQEIERKVALGADWFDAEYMFGVDGGFDVVIGNPPYVRADSGARHLGMRQRIEASQQYETLWEKWDLYIPFIERGYKLLTAGGFATMIVSDAYCHSKYAQKSQNWFLKNSRILRLDFFSKIQIFDASVRNVTYLFQKADGGHHKPQRRVHEPEFGVVKLLPTDEQRNLTYRAFFPEDTDVQQFSAPTVTLDEICYVSVGMVVHADEKRAPGAFELRDLVSDTRDERHPKPFVEGKHLARWLPATNKWLEWGTERAPGLFRRPTFPELYDVDAKMLIMRITGQEVRVCLDEEKLLCNHTSIICVPWYSLSGIRNGSIKRSTRYLSEKPKRSDLPQREILEENSFQFGIKFLIGVMNSSSANYFLQSVRRSNTDLYPDDWKKLPIPDVTPEQQAPVVELVNQILATKRIDPNADIADLETEVDRLVYRLYGLAAEETGTVEEQK